MRDSRVLNDCWKSTGPRGRLRTYGRGAFLVSNALWGALSPTPAVSDSRTFTSPEFGGLARFTLGFELSMNPEYDYLFKVRAKLYPDKRVV